jgi:hypothetical protein
MYWHMGDATMRLRRVVLFRVYGENKLDMVGRRWAVVKESSLRREAAPALAGFAAVIAYFDVDRAPADRPGSPVLD